MERFSILYLLRHSSRSIAAFNGASACVNAVCFPLITWPWTWLKYRTSVYVHFCSVHAHACMLLCCAFREVCVCIYFAKMWPFHTMCVIAFITTTHCIQPVFDILWWSNTKVLCGKLLRGLSPTGPSSGEKPQQSQAVTETMSIWEIWL